MITHELLVADKLFHDLAEHISHRRITPLNIAEIQHKFLKKKFSPIFTYGSIQEPLQSYKDTLQTLNLKGHLAAHVLMQRKRQELLDKIALVESVGTQDFCLHSQKLYAKPNKRLVDKAYGLLDLPESPISAYIPKDEARKMLRTSMKQLGFSWKITNKNIVTSALVLPAHRQLVLRSKERFHLKFVQRLIIHEIGTHAARAENGALQPLRIFVHGLAGYLDTEEGLAAYNEERAGILDSSTLKNYAGRVVAVDTALRSSFLDTYKVLREHFTPKQALKLTLRAKRGLQDPSLPGAFTRDATYLRGYLAVKKFVEKDKGSINDLMLGKIGVDDVDLVKSIPGIVAARYLPEPLFVMNKPVRVDRNSSESFTN